MALRRSREPSSQIPDDKVNCFTQKIDHHQSGFTLLEVMVAMAILAIALTTIYSSQNQIMSVASVNDFSATSAHLGSLQMAEILGRNELQLNDAGNFDKPYEGYSWQAEINRERRDLELVPDFNWAGLQRIDLTITDERRQQSFTITRYRWKSVME